MLNANGINAASISYDSRETLARFAAAYNIAFPLLSDVGSKVIRSFGILNTNAPPDHMMYGVPFPGTYLVTPDGVVREKVFLPNHELRPTAAEVVFRNYPAEDSPNPVAINTDVLDATIGLSTDRCFAGNEIAFSLKIAVKPGWHVYGKPLPDNYHATELSFEGPLVDEQSLDLPPPKPILLKALGETLPVYEGEIRAVGKLAIKWSPPFRAPFLMPLGEWIEPGLHKLPGMLRFQACSDSVCEAPQSIRFELPLTLDAMVAQAPKDAK